MCSKQHKFEPTHVYANICPKLLTEDCDPDAKNKNCEPRRVEVCLCFIMFYINLYHNFNFIFSADQCVLI